MSDLSTTYMGLALRNPLIASSSPLCQSPDNIRRMAENGVAAVVLPSLFEEQITLEEEKLNWYLLQGTEHFPEALTYFPDIGEYRFAPDEYLMHLEQAKKMVDIPIIGSLNGVSIGGWTRYARKMEAAGADAIELNIFYLPSDPVTTSAQVEDDYVNLLREVKKNVSIPIGIKLSPYFSSIPNVLQRLADSGADGLVLFNRFYQPDIDVENLEVTPNLRLSTSDELLLRLRWLAILYSRIGADMAVTGGVHAGLDIVKSLAAGATAVMVTSAFLQRGVPYASRLVDEVGSWMDEHGYATVSDLRGIMSQQAVAEPNAFIRANYMKVLGSYPPHKEG